MSISDKIGEGTYGCVHKPSLLCNTKPPELPNYNNKISKLMEAKEAKDELKEFYNIKRIDPNDHFHSGTPTYCTPSNDISNVKAAKKCSIESIRNVIPNLRDTLALLVMEDGGKDLRKIVSDFWGLPINDASKTKIHKLIIAFERAFIGIKELNDNGYIHNDIKIDNIVYNSDTNILNFIDFGLTKPLPNLLQQCKNDLYFDNCHWNFVPEIAFLNKSKYERVRKLYDEKNIARSIQDIYKKISNNNGKSWSDYALSEQYPTKKGNALSLIFQTKYSQIEKTIQNIGRSSNSFSSKYKSVNGLHKKSITSMDSYALGQAFSFCIYRLQHFLTPPYDTLKDQLLSLTEEMTNWNCFDRQTPDYYLNKYQQIIKSSGILNQYSLEISEKPNNKGYHTIVPISKDVISLQTIFKTPTQVKLPIRKIKKIRVNANRPEAPVITSNNKKISSQTKKNKKKPSKKSNKNTTRKNDNYSQDKRWKGQQLRDRLASVRKTPKGQKHTKGFPKKEDIIREIRRIEKEQGISPKSINTYL